MADLAALAENVKDGPDFKKASSRTKAPNPFEAILRDSYQNGSAPKSLEVSNDADAKAVERAVRRAGDATRIGVRIGQRTRGNFGRPVVHFKGVDKRKSNGDKPAEDEQDTGQDE
jgi:hypothetical protein